MPQLSIERLNNITSLSIFCIPVWFGCTSLALVWGKRDSGLVQFGDLFPVSVVSEARSHEGQCSCDADGVEPTHLASSARHFKGIIWPDFVSIRDWRRIYLLILYRSQPKIDHAQFPCYMYSYSSIKIFCTIRGDNTKSPVFFKMLKT